MRRHPRAIAVAAALACVASAPALAQSMPCAPRERVLTFVIDERQEARLATADAARGAVVELFAGDAGTWTILIHLPDGRSCLLANGQGFQATAGLQPARGEPA